MKLDSLVVLAYFLLFINGVMCAVALWFDLWPLALGNVAMGVLIAAAVRGA